MQVGNSFPQTPPLEILLRSSFFGPEDPEIAHGVDGGFGSPQHTDVLAIGFVVKLGGVAVHPVLDAIAFLAALQIGFQGPLEVGRNGSGLVHLPAEVAHHVRAGETQHAVP